MLNQQKQTLIFVIVSDDLLGLSKINGKAFKCTVKLLYFENDKIY